MTRFHQPALWALGFTAVFTAHAYADDDPPKPTSAGDVGGNIKSFFNGLGKGVTVRQPYAEYDVVSRGVVPGRGAGYCLKGEPMPHLESAANQVNLALIPCKTLEEAGQFQRVTNGATAASPAQGVGGSAASVDPSKQCTYHQIPIRDGTGDQWCVMKDGHAIGRVHYVMNKTTGNYEQEFTRFEKPVSSGVLTAGGGNPALPANAQAGWDNLDRMKADGFKKIEADSAARASANAEKSMTRKAAYAKCKPLIDGDNAKMDAFKACVHDATQ
jgi:hypothetical protein